MAAGRVSSQIAVYTANVGRYDRLTAPVTAAGTRWVCFADVRLEAVAPWEVRLKSRQFRENVMEGKRFKCCPHLHLPNYRYSVWQDASVRLKVAPQVFLEFLQGADIALMRHPNRDCAYREAKVCRDYRLDKPKRLRGQADRYRREGFPERWGLWDCSFIVRRHTPEVNVFGELWLAEIEANSRRDQISFPYLAWKMGITVADITARRGRKNRFMAHGRHRGGRKLWTP